MPGIEPGAFHMQSERATTALHPLIMYYVEIYVLQCQVNNWYLNEGLYLFLNIINLRAMLNISIPMYYKQGVIFI